MRREIFFYKSHAEHEAWRLDLHPVLFFKKALYEVRANGLQHSVDMFWRVVCSLTSIYFASLAYNKSKLYKNLDYWSRDMVNFDFLEKSLWIVFPPHFVYKFCNCPNFIIWLRVSLFDLLFEILGNMCIAIICFQGCDVMNFEINLTFPAELFFYMTKKPKQKFKYIENKIDL